MHESLTVGLHEESRYGSGSVDRKLGMPLRRTNA